MIILLAAFQALSYVCVTTDAFGILPSRHPPIAGRRMPLKLAAEGGANDWMESLRARQQELQTQQYELEQKWRNADCESGVKVELPDWIRRMDVGDYPYAACGSAAGTIYCVNVETGDILAQSSHSSAMLRETDENEKELDNLDETLHLLYGNWDGGGTLAIAMHGNLICAAGRQGSVQVYSFDASSKTLISQGSMQALEGEVITALELDDDFLWVGTADGKLQAFSTSSLDTPLPLQREPFYQWKFASAITSLSLNSEINCGVCSTAMGSVEVFDMEDDERALLSWLPPFQRDEYAQTATIALRKDVFSIFCGGSEGSLFIQPLRCDAATCVLDDMRPFGDGGIFQCRPGHAEAVRGIVCPSPELMVTGGADGTIKVWDIAEKSPSCLYQFIGYKVWLGSMWTDGERLVSDGSDNTLVVHDFEKEQQTLE
mmetsp:Transcript_13239/g.18745  ORF Transcript_13239/g.18745 Transcript_13239/m.18745 type:complete len:431 (-) Transcript_13239:35-1327(-)